MFFPFSKSDYVFNNYSPCFTVNCSLINFPELDESTIELIFHNNFK